MRISTLIKELQAIKSAEGDLKVTWTDLYHHHNLKCTDSIITIDKCGDGGKKFLNIQTC